MALTAAVLFVLITFIAFIWPASYRSSATILIEEQEVPLDLVRSAINSFADQRIEKIKQQVMTRSNLMKIVEEFGLYTGLRERSTTEDVLEEFTDSISIEVISADVVDRRTGRPTKATIAFMLSYDGESPVLAQKVTDELTNLFLSENLKSRERQAQETTVFLRREAENLEQDIERFETEIAEFKQQADKALPELFEVNMQLMNQADRELLDLKQRLTALEDRKIHLEGQLAIIKPNTPIVTVTGERILDTEERLKALRAQYISSTAIMTHSHPDIIKMRQEIEALEQATHLAPGSGELRKRLENEHAKIEGLLEQYGDEHPDVIQSRRIISSLEKEIYELAKPVPPAQESNPENPAFIQILAQLNATINEIQSLKQSERTLRTKMNTYADRLTRTSELEPEYLELTRNRDNTAQKFHEVRLRLLEARVSQELEEQRKGERFSLIDPADLPQKPVSPNRSAIILLGLLIAMTGGVGAGMVAENLDHSIHTSAMLTELTRLPPLSTIPFMPNSEDLERMSKKRRALGWSSVGALIMLVVLVHFIWLPLDVAWYVALRKLGFS